MYHKMISVVVPTYNVQNYVLRTIHSIIYQLYSNLQIIIVDDGATDNSGAICDNVINDDNRIYVIHQKNKGLSGARNTGINFSTGTFISFIDSDDFIETHMLSELYALILKDNSDVAICSYRYIDEVGNEIFKTSPIENEVLTRKQALEKLNNSQWWYYITAWNKLYKKSLFCKIRFPVGKINEDAFIAHEIFGLCNTISTTSDMLYNYTQRENSIMNQSVGINRLDGVEALCNRCSFYKNNSYKDLISGTVEILKNEFDSLFFRITPHSLSEHYRLLRVQYNAIKLILPNCKNIDNRMKIRYIIPAFIRVYFRNLFKNSNKKHL